MAPAQTGDHPLCLPDLESRASAFAEVRNSNIFATRLTDAELLPAKWASMPHQPRRRWPVGSGTFAMVAD